MGKNIAYSLFGKTVRPYLSYFDSLKISLRKGMIKTPVHEYVCNILLYSLIAFIASIIVSSFFVTIIIGSIIPINTFTDLIFAYTFSIILSMLIGGAMFFLGYYYPSFMAKNINTNLI